METDLHPGYLSALGRSSVTYYWKRLANCDRGRELDSVEQLRQVRPGELPLEGPGVLFIVGLKVQESSRNSRQAVKIVWS